MKDGVERVRFGDPGWRLGFARDAINSYFVFSVMKEKGVLPPHLRFQVSIPQVNSVLPPRIFPDRARPGAHPARLRGGPARRDRQRSSRTFRASELAIQWDCSTEIQDSYGSIPGFPLEGAVERNLTQVRNLSPHIPAEVALGYHFCFGTLGGWPRFQPDDLGQAVELANGCIAASGRRVDWVHIPVLDRSDDAFFAPLQNLKRRYNPRLPRRHPQHGAVPGANRHGSQVPADLRSRRLLRVRTAAGPAELAGNCSWRDPLFKAVRKYAGFALTPASARGTDVPPSVRLPLPRRAISGLNSAPRAGPHRR